MGGFSTDERGAQPTGPHDDEMGRYALGTRRRRNWKAEGEDVILATYFHRRKQTKEEEGIGQKI